MEAVDVAAESAETAARRPPTVGLDFNEAMADFKTMFPTLDDEVIEAVLRCNKGSVDRTVDQLLTMSCECRAADLLNNGPGDAGGLPVQHALFDPMLPDVLHNLGKKAARQIGGSSSSRWNPPMLGPLPTDFLRLTTAGGLTSQVSESELNDEQIAILLQNEEFLVQLRKNEQFLSTLDKDSPVEEQKFFIPNQTPGDDDAAFKERLKNMGKASRKKFIQIARVFTGKKKKSSARNIMNQGDTHTKDNLFLHEEEH
ncbi:CUE domain-containing protein 1 isoform X1 [Metopolophium dirhodum]|uniref:CUE domain-containing protein 1 isoform X1 n=1 Tax=Metopolophium dirhodum TaxID=44670 RepID=UPI002990509C|nr:CUE domain-containing protein 1 isoform X1 [Metopolophium dirhodum]